MSPDYDNLLFFCRKDANSALLSNYEVGSFEVFSSLIVCSLLLKIIELFMVRNDWIDLNFPL